MTRIRGANQFIEDITSLFDKDAQLSDRVKRSNEYTCRSKELEADPKYLLELIKILETYSVNDPFKNEGAITRSLSRDESIAVDLSALWYWVCKVSFASNSESTIIARKTHQEILDFFFENNCCSESELPTVVKKGSKAESILLSRYPEFIGLL